MNNKKGSNSCEYCKYAVKDYMSIGCDLRFSGVSLCLKTKPSEAEKPFKMKTDCEKFVRKGFPAPTNTVEERLDYLSRQVYELRDILLMVLRKVESNDDEIIDNVIAKKHDD